MKDRIKKLRKALDLTQQEFADKIRVKRNTVGQWECGINALTDQVINSICKEFKVNEEWIRTGNGEMFIEQTRDEQIVEWVGKMQAISDDSFKKKFVAMLSQLDEADWELLERMAIKLYKEKD